MSPFHWQYFGVENQHGAFKLSEAQRLRHESIIFWEQPRVIWRRKSFDPWHAIASIQSVQKIRTYFFIRWILVVYGFGVVGCTPHITNTTCATAPRRQLLPPIHESCLAQWPRHLQRSNGGADQCDGPFWLSIWFSLHISIYLYLYMYMHMHVHAYCTYIT